MKLVLIVMRRFLLLFSIVTVLGGRSAEQLCCILIGVSHSADVERGKFCLCCGMLGLVVMHSFPHLVFLIMEFTEMFTATGATLWR